MTKKTYQSGFVGIFLAISFSLTAGYFLVKQQSERNVFLKQTKNDLNNFKIDYYANLLLGRELRNIKSVLENPTDQVIASKNSGCRPIDDLECSEAPCLKYGESRLIEFNGISFQRVCKEIVGNPFHYLVEIRYEVNQKLLSIKKGTYTPIVEPGVIAVKKIASSNNAFAALKSDGSVVVWGHPVNGGDLGAESTNVESGVIDIASTWYSFAALKDNGSVVSWGQGMSGSDFESKKALLTSGIVAITGNESSFQALKSNGSVVSWGSYQSGGIQGNNSGYPVNPTLSNQLLSKVIEIHSNGKSNSALKSDGSIVSWGSPHEGGFQDTQASLLTSEVINIIPARQAYSAIKSNGSVISWGRSNWGATQGTSAPELTSNVVSVHGSAQAFSALKSDGSVISWGTSYAGGRQQYVSQHLTSNIKKIVTGGRGFNVLKTDGSFITWGGLKLKAPYIDKVNSDVADISKNIAIKADGSVLPWTGTFKEAEDKLAKNVAKIFLGGLAYLKVDGSIIINDTSEEYDAISSNFESGVQDFVRTAYCSSILKEDGSVFSWGPIQYDAHGCNQGDKAEELTGGEGSVKELSCNSSGCIFLKSNSEAFGTVTTTSSSELNSGIAEIFSNNNSFIARKSDSTIIIWGGINEAPSKKIKEVYTVDNHVCALEMNGNLSCFGGNGFSESNVSSVKSFKNKLIVFRTDGSISDFPNSSSFPKNPATNFFYRDMNQRLLSTTYGYKGIKQKFRDGARFSNMACALQYVSNTTDAQCVFNSTTFNLNLTDIDNLYYSSNMVCAKRTNGSVYCHDGTSGSNKASLVSRIYGGKRALVATHAKAINNVTAISGGGANDDKYGGSLFIYKGNPEVKDDNPLTGADESDMSTQVFDLKDAVSSYGAFLGLRSDGKVVTWGHRDFGARLWSETQAYSGVKKIVASTHSFAILTDSGRVFSWGSGGAQGSKASELLSGVSDIGSAIGGDYFWALKSDGDVVTWGNYPASANSSLYKSRFKNW